MKKNKGLYIHIPYCDELCPYCSFCHVYKNYGREDEYINKLISEIDLINEDIYSIYVGGGTPSSLDDDNFEKLLKSLSRLLKEDTSFSIEFNPTSFSNKKLELIKKYGVNRVSLGVQTFNNKLQKIINRYCSYEDIKNIIYKLNEVGINDINLDLMYGIPTQNLEDLKEDLKLYKSLNVNHISCYSLQVEEHTIFFNKNIKEMDEDNLSLFYEEICSSLKEAGYIHYEVSNFAKENKESKHNLLYWLNQEYIGLGVSASGYEDNIRYTNDSSIKRYIENSSLRKEEILSLEDEKIYQIILALRLKDGLSLKEYKERFNSSFTSDYKEIIDELVNKKLCVLDDEKFYVLEKYMFTLNQILLKFI